MTQIARSAALLALFCVAAAANTPHETNELPRLGSGAFTGIFIGLFLVACLFMGISSILSIQTPDAIGRSFKKDE
ncbi:hypothetical protein DIPPA_12546 [Diplonema papillatum]|nr:hypothetical protein DIPPA_12546 [Diplonema papillatum]